MSCYQKIQYLIQSSSPFFNCEASDFLIKYQVLSNTARIAPDGNVVNQLCSSRNLSCECEKHIFKIEVLTPIHCCNLNKMLGLSLF